MLKRLQIYKYSYIFASDFSGNHLLSIFFS